MFYSCMESVLRDINYQKRLQKIYRKELALLKNQTFSDWHLKVKTHEGESYYVMAKKVAGEQLQENIKKMDNWKVQVIQKRYFLEKSLANISINIKALEKLISHYRSIDPESMRQRFPKAYQYIPEDCYDLSGAINIKDWAKRNGRGNDFRPEGKKHKTKCGLWVRSKSEVILANAFTNRGIHFIYETKRKIGAQFFAPDFILISPIDNREIIWEHFGMLSDPEYRKNFEWKLEQYIMAGYIPGVNLIITFDDMDGNIDSLMIERTLDLWFGPAI